MQILFSRTIAMSDNSKDIYLVLKKSIVPKYLCNDIPGAHTHINSVNFVSNHRIFKNEY